MNNGLIREWVRKLGEQFEKSQSYEQQISNFLNEHYNISTIKLPSIPAFGQ